MERRVFAAVVASIAVLVLYQAFVVTPRQPVPAPAAAPAAPRSPDGMPLSAPAPPAIKEAQSAGTAPPSLDVANSELRLGRFESAARLFENHLRASPNSLEARNNLGVAYIRLRRYQDAERQLNLVLQIEAARAGTRQNLGVANEGIGNLSAALSETERALSDMTRQRASQAARAAALFNKGWLLDEQDNLSRAADAYRLALQVRPNYARASIGLAIALGRLGQPDEARKVLTSAALYEGEDPTLKRLIAANLEALDRPNVQASPPWFQDRGWVERNYVRRVYPVFTIVLFIAIQFVGFLLVLNMCDVLFGRAAGPLGFLACGTAAGVFALYVWGWTHWVAAGAMALGIGAFAGLVLSRRPGLRRARY